MSADSDASVISDVTLDEAFNKSIHSDRHFHENVVVAKSSTNRRRKETLVRFESISKMDGSEFLNGKFKSEFHKEKRMQLPHDNETNGTLKRDMVEKKKAIEELNRQRQVSNARLEDLPGNLDLFTSSRLADDAPEEKKERPRRLKSSEGIRKKSEHAPREVR